MNDPSLVKYDQKFNKMIIVDFALIFRLESFEHKPQIEYSIVTIWIECIHVLHSVRPFIQMSRNRKLEKLGQLEKLDYAHDLQDANLESDVRNIKDKMNGHQLTNQRPSWSTSL